MVGSSLAKEKNISWSPDLPWGRAKHLMSRNFDLRVKEPSVLYGLGLLFCLVLQNLVQLGIHFTFFFFVSEANGQK
jgi:hypothetical protein